MQAYARWMAAHQVAGVAVWAHTGRGPHLSSQQRRQVLAAWRAALPMSTIVAGADSIAMALGLTACRSADALAAGGSWLSAGKRSVLAAAAAFSLASAVLLLGG